MILAGEPRFAKPGSKHTVRVLDDDYELDDLDFCSELDNYEPHKMKKYNHHNQIFHKITINVPEELEKEYIQYKLRVNGNNFVQDLLGVAMAGSDGKHVNVVPICAFSFFHDMIFLRKEW